MTDTDTDRNPNAGAEPAIEPNETLDRKVVGNLTLEQVLFIAVMIIAVVSRLYEAGVRPLHHDESIHAVFSWKIVTEGLGAYQYDPVYHGPVLYYWTALCFWLLGDTDFVARLSPILFGLGVLGLAWPLRRFIGRWGALAFLVLVTISPSWLYFTRFLRHDIYGAFCNMAAAVCLFRYGQTLVPRYLYGFGAMLGLGFANKEDMYALGPLLIISLVFTFVWEIVYARDWGKAWADFKEEAAPVARRAIVPGITTVILFCVVWLVFYTSFLNHPQHWLAVDEAIGYWMGQHNIQRIGGPWWYYFPHMAFYEQLIFFPAVLYLFTPLIQPRANEWHVATKLTVLTWVLTLAFVVSLFAFPERAPLVLLAALTVAGFVHMLRWLPSRFVRFTIVWALGSFVFYAWAQEKVPWLLIPIITPMVILSAVWFRELIASGAHRKPAVRGVLGVLLVLTCWTSFASNYLSDAPRPSEQPGERRGELLAYVQSTYDIHEKVMAKVDEIGEKLGTGSATRLAISGEATWPMSWYVRDYPVNWGAGLRKVDFPLLIVDLDAANSLREPLSEKYDEQRFQIRGWWEPQWNNMFRHANFPGLIGWIIRREAFTFTPDRKSDGYGSSDAVMFSLKEVEPGMQITAIEVNPPPPPRGYSTAPEEVQPAAVWGGQGSGRGEFNEPRGLSVDSRGNVFVADSKNHRVQKLGPDGTPLLTWGSKGGGEGEFNDPCGIAVSSDGFVYVADTWNHRVQKFDLNGKFIREWRDANGFWGPRGIAVSPDGKSIYVTDTGNKRVLRYDNDGNPLGNWGGEGSQSGQLIEPVGIAVNSAGEVLVADTGNRRIQVFDAEGKFLRKFQVSGWEEFYSEPYIAASGESLLVTDSYNHRVARYEDGRVSISWGKSGNTKGSFNRPIGVAADNQGAVYVSDTLNHRIQKFFLP